MAFRQSGAALRRVLALASALALMAPAGLSAQAIRMSWFTAPPHMFPPDDSGPPTGPSIALFETIAARMGYQVEWIGPIPLSRLDHDRETGELRFDGGILTIKTPNWTEYLLYPSRSYYEAMPCIAVLSDNPLRKVESIADIDGYRIGFVKTFAEVYPRIIIDHRDRLVVDELGGEDWTKRNIRKLLEGRLDAVLELNRYSLSYDIAAAGVGDKIRILLLPAVPLEHYFVFNKTSPRARTLLDAYERAVAGFPFDYDAMLEAEIARRTGPAGGAKGR